MPTMAKHHKLLLIWQAKNGLVLNSLHEFAKFINKYAYLTKSTSLK